jgi:hypothetical protein
MGGPAIFVLGIAIFRTASAANGATVCKELVSLTHKWSEVSRVYEVGQSEVRRSSVEESLPDRLPLSNWARETGLVEI